MAGQLHAPATLPEGKERPVPTERTLGGTDNWSGRFDKKDLLPLPVQSLP